MHALIVVSHPDPTSLSHRIAAHVGEGVSLSGREHSFEIADLAAEAFDPRYTAADRASYLRKAPTPADVAAEQTRIDRADDLVLVYPVYWWSMPAALKGWIDRVFAQDWAYDDRPGAEAPKKLGRLRVHLIAIGAADQPTYERHGYLAAMKAQIEHGIFDYCGARVVTSALLLESDPHFPASHGEKAREIGRALFQTSRQLATA
jgi:NAD(P)H dehydrogenase (quinone)